jgi:beta-glucosidase
MKKITFIAILSLFLTMGFSLRAQVPQLGKNPVNEVVAAMTLEEKASLVVGNGFYTPGLKIPGMSTEPKEEQKKVPGVAGTTCAIPRLGIPSMAMADGPSGVDVYDFGQKRVYYATSWPSPTLTAAGTQQLPGK